MLLKTKGIVLHYIKYSESSIIATIYTEELGRQAYLISGLRQKKANHHISFLQPMVLLDMQVYHKQNQTLHRIKEFNPSVPQLTIPYDINKTTITLFLAEILYKTIQEQEQNKDLFSYLYHSFIVLDCLTEGIANFHIAFLFNLTKFLGFYPNKNFSIENKYFNLLTGDFVNSVPLHSNSLNELQSSLWITFFNITFENLSKFKMNNTLRNEMLEKILVYYKLHIPNIREVKSYEVLKDVFSK
jgi:DNA repair protein RecO (recombination protein O)